MLSLIPKTADYVYDASTNSCIIRFAEPGDGIAFARKINVTPFNGHKVSSKSVASRSKSKKWEMFTTLKNKRDAM